MRHKFRLMGFTLITWDGKKTEFTSDGEVQMCPPSVIKQKILNYFNKGKQFGPFKDVELIKQWI